MTAYVDASVILRVLMRERNSLAEWDSLSGMVASVLLQVESLRVADRLRQTRMMPPELYPHYRKVILQTVASIRLVPLTPEILGVAADPMPAPLGTLDAIHLATALRYRKEEDPDLIFATHDQALAAAARIYGFPVMGC